MLLGGRRAGPAGKLWQCQGLVGMRALSGDSLMAETPGHTRQRRMRAVVAGRLFGARWPLAALAACLLIAWGFGWLSAALAAIVLPSCSRQRRWRRAARFGRSSPIARTKTASARLEAFRWRIWPRRCPTRSHLRRRRRGVACQRSRGRGIRSVCAGLSAAAPVPGPGNAAAHRRHAVRRRPKAASSTMSRGCRSSASSASPAPASAADGALFVLVFKDQSEAAASTACAPISSPTPATNCARRWPRSPASSRRCAARPATMPRRASSFLKIMQEQTGRMARLIDDLLSLSRLEMKPFLPAGIEVDIREAIDSVIDFLGPLARETGVEIDPRISGGTGRGCRQPRRAVPGVRELLGERLQIWPVGRQGRRLDRAAGASAEARRPSASAISARASPPSTFRASPSASTVSTSTPAAAVRAPALAWRSSSTY